MCARVTQKEKLDLLGHLFKVEYTYKTAADWEPRYNLSPGQEALVVRETEPDGRRELKPLLWGLIPHWAKERGTYSTINARLETVDEKPAFRTSFKHRRAIIPVSGYYEWTQTPSGKQPWYFHGTEGAPLALAGLWDDWRDPEDPQGTDIETFTIIVRPATGTVLRVHDRMPAIVPQDMWDEWLDPASKNLSGMKERLLALSPGHLDGYPVSRRVNSSRNEGADLIRPIAAP